MTDALKTAFREALEEWHSSAWGTVPAVDFFTAALTRRGVVVQAEGQREALRYENAKGATVDEMRESFVKTELWKKGDARLVWVNEGDLCFALVDYSPEAYVRANQQAVKRFEEANKQSPRSDVEAVSPTRKVIHLAYAASSQGSWPIALADDGTMWGMPGGLHSQNEWRQIPPIPQPGADQ